MNTNKKLALNKQLVANLDGQNMAEVKGGAYPTWGSFCTYFYQKMADWLLSDAGMHAIERLHVEGILSYIESLK